MFRDKTYELVTHFSHHHRSTKLQFPCCHGDLSTNLGGAVAGEDFGLLLSFKPSIHPGSGTEILFMFILLKSLPPASHMSARLNGTTQGWEGEEGR